MEEKCFRKKDHLVSGMCVTFVICSSTLTRFYSSFSSKLDALYTPVSLNDFDKLGVFTGGNVSLATWSCHCQDCRKLGIICSHGVQLKNSNLKLWWRWWWWQIDDVWAPRTLSCKQCAMMGFGYSNIWWTKSSLSCWNCCTELGVSKFWWLNFSFGVKYFGIDPLNTIHKLLIRNAMLPL